MTTSHSMTPTQARYTTPMSAQCVGQRCDAIIEVGQVAGQTAILRDQATTPLKLICPSRQSKAAWVYMSSYGGGMVAGDEVNLNLKLQQGSTLILTTQASNKIYHRTGETGATQRIHAEIESDASLLLAPDPLVCFEDARYTQEQSFHLKDESASLILVDWFTAGRMAMGERWAFDQYDSRNVIRLGDRTIVRDRLILNALQDDLQSSVLVTGEMNCMATVMIIGTRWKEQVHDLKNTINAQALNPEAEVIHAISPFAWGAVWRLAGRRADQVGRVLSEGLDFVKPEIGAGLWERKW